MPCGVCGGSGHNRRTCPHANRSRTFTPRPRSIAGEGRIAEAPRPRNAEEQLRNGILADGFGQLHSIPGGGISAVLPIPEIQNDPRSIIDYFVEFEGLGLFQSFPPESGWNINVDFLDSNYIPFSRWVRISARNFNCQEVIRFMMQDRIARGYPSVRIRVEAMFNRHHRSNPYRRSGHDQARNIAPVEDRHAQLEELARKVEAGEITEGQYLEACNALRS